MISNVSYCTYRRAPWVRKFGYLCIRDILAATWPYARPSAPQDTQSEMTFFTLCVVCNLCLTWWQRSMLWSSSPPALLERKNNNKAGSFFRLNLLSTLTWITKKELERDEFRGKKNMESQSGGEKMRNAKTDVFFNFEKVQTLEINSRKWQPDDFVADCSWKIFLSLLGALQLWEIVSWGKLDPLNMLALFSHLLWIRRTS